MNIKLYGKIKDLIVNSPETLKASRKSQSAFTRKSLLSFSVVVLLLLDMHKTALQARGNSFFRQLLGGYKMRITKQAISKRRNEFDHTPFVKMTQALVAEEYSGRHKTTLWNGYYILSIDGSYLQLPRENDLRSTFGVRGSNDFPMAGMSVLYDVLHGWPIDATITQSNMNERTECMNHINYLCDKLPHVAKNCILTLDRGYPSLEMYTFLAKKGINYIARCSVKALKEINEAPAGDSVVILKNGEKLRVIKIADLFGTEYILVTNNMDLTLLEIVELYGLRWGVETMFRVLKDHLFIEGFSGKTANSILQDFHATMVILIGVAILQKEGNRIAKALRKHKKSNKYEVEVNTSNLVATMRDRYIFLILNHQDEGYKEIEIMDIIYKIADAVIPIIKNRSFPRKPKPHYKAKHNLKVRA
jgi:hypothetical protein